MAPELDVVQLLTKTQSDFEWFAKNFTSFLKKYNEMFVAIYNHEIIESDSNIDNLLEKLNSKGFDPSDVIIRFISRVKAIL